MQRFDIELPEGPYFAKIVAEFTQTAAQIQTGQHTPPTSPRSSSRAIMKDQLAPLPAHEPTSAQRYFAVRAYTDYGERSDNKLCVQHDAHLHDTQAVRTCRATAVCTELMLFAVAASEVETSVS